MKGILWKYDREFGWLYICPSCKKPIYIKDDCTYCNQTLNWDRAKEYKGRVDWGIWEKESEG